MSVTVELHELEELKRNLESLRDNTGAFMEQAAMNIAMRALRKIKRRTPRRTGNLRNAWQIADTVRNGDSITVTITNSADYAPHVEYGHRLVRNGVTTGYVRGRFMMTVSMQEIEQEKGRLIQRELEKYLGRVFG